MGQNCIKGRIGGDFVEAIIIITISADILIKAKLVLYYRVSIDSILEIVKELLYYSLYIRELFLGGIISRIFGLKVIEGITVAIII